MSAALRKSEPPESVPVRIGDLVRRAGPEDEPHLDLMIGRDPLDARACAAIVAMCRCFPLVPPSTVGEDRYPAHRQADTRQVRVNDATAPLFALLCDVAERANALAFALDLTTINRAPQYVEYRPGWGHFDWHNDYSHGTGEAPRKVTIIIQLSPPDAYEGGRLELFGNGVEALPDALGTVIAFPSILPHRVTPVTRGCRRALVSWIAGPRLR